MQLSALTAPVRVISHFCCHKSIFTSFMTGVENYFWPRQDFMFLSFFIRDLPGRFSLRGFRWGKNENYRLQGMREEMRDSGKVMGRRGEAKERCRSWQGGEPSNKYSRYGQCAEINDVISAWIDVCTVPLKRGSLYKLHRHPSSRAQTRALKHTRPRRRHTKKHTHHGYLN